MCLHFFLQRLSPFSIAVNTSCGLPLKTLRRTPMYVCGTYLVMLASPPGVSGSSATRSLFGGSSGLSSLKSECKPPVCASCARPHRYAASHCSMVLPSMLSVESVDGSVLPLPLITMASPLARQSWPPAWCSALRMGSSAAEPTSSTPRAALWAVGRRFQALVRTELNSTRVEV